MFVYNVVINYWLFFSLCWCYWVGTCECFCVRVYMCVDRVDNISFSSFCSLKVLLQIDFPNNKKIII